MSHPDPGTLAVLAAVDEEFYLNGNPDVAGSPHSPRVHFLRQGCEELRQPNPWFDARWYASTYPDVVDSGAVPLRHYLAVGWREGRLPHPEPSVQELVRRVAEETDRICPVLVLVARAARDRRS